MDPAGANIVLNTIVAEALDEICTKLESAKGDFNEALQSVLADIIKKHKRILFNGDNYTQEWLDEAAKRGLPNLKNTEEALEVLNTQKAKDLFARYDILSNQELESRYNTYKEAYETLIEIEASAAAQIAKTMIVPAVVAAINEYSSVSAVSGITDEMSELLKKTIAGIAALEKAEGVSDQIAAMNELRESADALEGLVPEELWPMPSYAEMLFS
jgi:glutamine synthetase